MALVANAPGNHDGPQVHPRSRLTSASINDLPVEILTTIGQLLFDPNNYENRNTQGGCDYSDLLAFGLVNKRCSDVGQNVLFGHCDLTSNLAQLVKLLWTIYKSPAGKTLAGKIKALVIKLPDEEKSKSKSRVNEPHQQSKSISVWTRYRLDDPQTMATETTFLPGSVSATGIFDHNTCCRLPSNACKQSWERWLRGMKRGFYVYFVMLLLAGTLELRTLEVRNLFLKDNRDVLVQGLRDLSYFGSLRKLRTMRLRGHFEPDDLPTLPSAFRLPALKSIDLALDPRFTRPAQTRTQHDWSANPGSRSGKSLVEFLILRHWDIEGELFHYLAHFNNIRSLTCDMGEDMTHNLWKALPPLKSTLVHLDINVNRNCFNPHHCDGFFREWFDDDGILDPVYFQCNVRRGTASISACAIWPKNMHEMFKVETFILRGAIELCNDGFLLPQGQARLLPEIHKKDLFWEVFPPNLKHFKYLPDRIALQEDTLWRLIKCKQREHSAYGLIKHFHGIPAIMVWDAMDYFFYTSHELIRDLQGERPTLSSVKLASPLWNLKFFVQLQHDYARNGRQIIRQDPRIERAEVWEVTGKRPIWRAWDDVSEEEYKRQCARADMEWQMMKLVDAERQAILGQASKEFKAKMDGSRENPPDDEMLFPSWVEM
ncbi:hypothetical protein SLS60_008413 [Paraconiothyrium brasiliense]|uniref:F-box domain-containing protein n=1 Tax=Paraconiothyrium brasiliense TaxID=300254 RepID=A0ABR3R0I9_9PLEO